VPTKIQLRRGTASQWSTANTVLLAGEQGYETDTRRIKIGDGTTAWNSLPYFNSVQTNARTSSYTLVLSDNERLIEMNNANANNLTIPLNSSVAFPIGTKIDILQTGAGQTTIVPTSGVTVNSNEGSLKLTGQWSAATLIKRGTNAWVLIGSITS
jgi:hypothetical protein